MLVIFNAELSTNAGRPVRAEGRGHFWNKRHILTIYTAMWYLVY